jgi:intracellular sulfur oxidation DsrE/DsrF family protein
MSVVIIDRSKFIGRSLMLRIVPLLLALTLSLFSPPNFATGISAANGTATTAPAGQTPAANGKNVTCAAPPETTAGAEAQATFPGAIATGPKVVFQLNKAEDAPTILRFVTNYLAVEPTAQIAVVGYAGGIDFMLQGARDSNDKLYAEQMATLTDRGVTFKVCNNTLRARNLTASAVSPSALVVPGAVNEIIRLQTREGYAYFQN